MTEPSSDRPRTVARLLAALVLLVLVASAVSIAVRITNPGAVRVGGALPAVQFTNARGQRTLLASGGTRTILMLVHTDCGHCEYQLATLEQNVDKLASTRLYILSTEPRFFADDYPGRFPRLTRSPSVVWGIVDRASFERTLGVMVTPALFVFDSQGHLVKGFRGETKIDALIAS